MQSRTAQFACAHPTSRPPSQPPFADGGSVVTEAKSGYGDSAAADWAGSWERVLFDLLASLPAPAREQIASIAIDGTSATAMLVDAVSGEVLAAPKLYNEAQGPEAVAAAKVRCVKMGCSCMVHALHAALCSRLGFHNYKRSMRLHAAACGPMRCMPATPGCMRLAPCAAQRSHAGA